MQINKFKYHKNMIKKYTKPVTLIIYLFFIQATLAGNTNFFDQGKNLYEDKKFEESKIYFEKDLVFNPKSEKSYLFLAKIFKNKDSEKEEEINLDSVLLLNPKNEEAIYLLTLLKIKQSDFEEAKNFI